MKMKSVPVIHVGIMADSIIRFRLDGLFVCKQTGKHCQGEYSCNFLQGKLQWENALLDVLDFTPITSMNDSSFCLHDVTIGIHFHWEREEDQVFRGSLRLQLEQDVIRAVNCIDAEQYIESVISSEMSANASLELLKAHAVISRSWLIRPIWQGTQPSQEGIIQEDGRRIVWYERDAHTGFDVCADDHCQRYQGITRATQAQVREAVNATRGELLLYNGKVCDARFSKACGGVTEAFENCWADEAHDYLPHVKDDAENTAMDLRDEATARAWIMSRPDSFCNTEDKAVLRQILNSYDQETADFYRWKVVYSIDELSALIQKKSGIDFGRILSLTPIRRGYSGRIVELEIEGEKKTMRVGKELEIRRWLSESHLYSSAFVVDRNAAGDFVLHGAGWGHGVGLCQIGAAMMAHKGYNYQQILAHYFKGAVLEKCW